MATTRIQDLWYDDGNIVLQAGTLTFKVHRSILCKQSEVFKDMLALGPTHNQREGTDDAPLLVPEVSGEAFANLLRMLYYIWGAKLSLDDTQLIEMLRVAHRLQFTEVLNVVIGILEKKLSAVWRYALGIECNIDTWVLPAFQDLVLDFTSHPLQSDPVRTDATVWFKIYRARQEVSRLRSQFAAQSQGSCCLHAFAALAAVAPHVRRDALPTAYADMHRKLFTWQQQSRGCCGPTKPNAQDLMQFLPSSEVELALVGGFL